MVHVRHNGCSHLLQHTYSVMHVDVYMYSCTYRACMCMLKASCKDQKLRAIISWYSLIPSIGISLKSTKPKNLNACTQPPRLHVYSYMKVCKLINIKSQLRISIDYNCICMVHLFRSCMYMYIYMAVHVGILAYMYMYIVKLYMYMYICMQVLYQPKFMHTCVNVCMLAWL